MIDLEQIKKLYQSGGNPMSLIPQEYKLLLSNTNDYEKLFYEIAKKYNVNPQEVLDFLNNKGGNK